MSSLMLRLVAVACYNSPLVTAVTSQIKVIRTMIEYFEGTFLKKMFTNAASLSPLLSEKKKCSRAHITFIRDKGNMLIETCSNM